MLKYICISYGVAEQVTYLNLGYASETLNHGSAIWAGLNIKYLKYRISIFYQQSHYDSRANTRALTPLIAYKFLFSVGTTSCLKWTRPYSRSQSCMRSDFSMRSDFCKKNKNTQYNIKYKLFSTWQTSRLFLLHIIVLEQGTATSQYNYLLHVYVRS